MVNEVFELVLSYIAAVFTTHGVLECVHWDPYPIHYTAIRAGHPNLCTTCHPKLISLIINWLKIIGN